MPVQRHCLYFSVISAPCQRNLLHLDAMSTTCVALQVNFNAMSTVFDVDFTRIQNDVFFGDQLQNLSDKLFKA